MTTAKKEPLFDRFASAVADFGSPFYAEERQRDVWNEASAFGFQFFLWGALAMSAVMFWVGGRPLLPYGAALMLFASLTSYLVIAYTRRLGVQVPGKNSLNGRRLAVFLLVYAADVLGALYAVRPLDSGAGAGFAAGLVISVAAVAGLIVVQRHRGRRRTQAEQAHPGL